MNLGKVLFCLVVLLFVSKISYADSIYADKRSIDSLLTISEQLNDSLKVNNLNDVSFRLLQTDPKLALFYAEMAKSLADSMNYPRGLASAYNNMGVYHNYMMEYSKSLEYFDKALQIYIDIKENTRRIMMELNIANIYFTQGELAKAMEMYQICLGEAEENGLSQVQISCELNMGMIYHMQASYVKALDLYFKALKKIEQKGSKAEISNCLNNIGTTYLVYKKYDEALDYFTKALMIEKELQNKRREATILNNIGNLFIQKEDYDLALENYNSALHILEELGEKRGVSVCLTNIGNLYSDLGKHNQAIYSFKQSLEIKQEANDKNGICISYINLAENYIVMKEYSNALDFAHKAYDVSDELGLQGNKLQSAELLSIIYDRQGNVKKAYEYLQEYSKLKESIFNEDKQKTIEEIKNSYAIEKKEQELLLKQQEIEILLKEKELGRMRFIVVSALGLVAIFLFALAYTRLVTRSKQNKAIFEKNKDIVQARMALQKEQLLSAELEKKNLETELNYNKKELTNLALQIVQKDDFLHVVMDNIDDIKSSSISKKSLEKIQSLTNIIKQNFSIEKDKKEFHTHVEKLNKEFLRKLSESHPTLTEDEKKLAVYLRLNLSSKEIATLFYITPSSVNMKRYRLRKKLRLEPEEDLLAFFNRV